MAEIESLCTTRDVAGLANSSQKPNTVFVDVWHDTVLEAEVDLEESRSPSTPRRKGGPVALITIINCWQQTVNKYDSDFVNEL